MNVWHDCDTPSSNRNVLVILRSPAGFPRIPRYYMRVAYYSHSRNRWILASDPTLEIDVTHWTELPEPPEDFERVETSEAK